MGLWKQESDFLSNTEFNNILRDYDLDYKFSVFAGIPYLKLVSYQFGEIGSIDETLRRNWVWAPGIVDKVEALAQEIGVPHTVIELKLRLVLEYLSENF